MNAEAVILYTTHYREGSREFKRAAETLYKDINDNFNTRLFPIHRKSEILQLFHDYSANNKEITELHFIGHSGMYGPMYGSVDFPEQFSPYELKKLDIPFSKNAKAYFHCCRSARWFAPYFSHVQGVKTYGYTLYTTFTSSKNKFKRISENSDVYAIGCAGKKSHGLIGSVKKYTTGDTLETMQSFSPNDFDVDRTYNSVAELYDKVFQDIKVREDEWNWLNTNLPEDESLTMVDVGCGNGALIKELSPRFHKLIGLDMSSSILERAETMNSENDNTIFKQIDGPNLPLEDNSADVIISMLSMRYLDWDPIFKEFQRVLKPKGIILILDMVTVPAGLTDAWKLIEGKLKQRRQLKKYPFFSINLTKLVSHPDWKKMLKFNPIRAEHEMKWYLESRFPGKQVEKINVGFNSSILAFNSGAVKDMEDIKLSYP